jgi:DNA sulfur modification protein DndB
MKNLTVEQVDKFIKTCILGRSVGLEILGRLLYSVYDKHNNCFDRIKVSQLAQLDWSISGDIWQGNVVRLDPKPKNSANPYKITASMSTIKIVIHQAQVKLGWVQAYTNLDF